MPVGIALRAKQHARRQGIVAVGEDIGLDDDKIANHSFDRKPAAVDFRPHALDDRTDVRLS
jgi:hypothetical protein